MHKVLVQQRKLTMVLLHAIWKMLHHLPIFDNLYKTTDLHFALEEH
jgi:hypothetical protein